MILDKLRMGFCPDSAEYLDWDRQEAKRLYEILKREIFRVR